MNIVRVYFPYHKMFWNNCSLMIFQFCVKMPPVEGICSSGSPGIDPQGKKSSRCQPQKIEGSSSHLVTFDVLPLEIGLHNINFSLETSLGREILVKTLRVVVRKACLFLDSLENTFFFLKKKSYQQFMLKWFRKRDREKKW